MQRTPRKSVGANVGAEFRVVIKLRVLNNLGGEFESLRPATELMWLLLCSELEIGNQYGVIRLSLLARSAMSCNRTNLPVTEALHQLCQANITCRKSKIRGSRFRLSSMQSRFLHTPAGIWRIRSLPIRVLHPRLTRSVHTRSFRRYHSAICRHVRLSRP